MREEDFYGVFDYADNLQPGVELKLEHSITTNYKKAFDLTPFTNTDLETLQKYRETSVAAEQKIFDGMKAELSKWERQAAITMVLDRAIEYLKTPEAEHTGNTWEKDRYADEKISNKVYQMSVSVYEDCTYNRQTQERIPTAWYVTWDLRLRSPKQGYGTHIAGQDRKRYTDKAAAMKYIEGRKKAYAHLFTEISPPIPQEYAEHFKVNGVLLPGYTVEGQEPITTIRTAAEVLNELSGGAFASMDKKPSVLGKLAAGKTEAKTAPSAGAKKKEDIHI